MDKQCEQQKSLRKTLKMFDTFLELYEDSAWMEHATECDVKNAFKLALYLENLYKKLETSNKLDAYGRVILQWWNSKGRACPSDFGVFEEACDLLLTVFLYNPKKQDSTLIAIREYIECCTKSRFEELLQNLLQEGISYRILFLILASCKGTNDIGMDLIFMSVWSKKLECGNKSVVKKQISDLLNDTKYIDLFMKMLSIEDENESQRNVKLCITEILFPKLKAAKNNPCYRLWCEICNVDVVVTLKVAQLYPEFLTLFLEFTELLKDIIECQFQENGEGYEWKSKDSTVMSTQDFEVLLKLLKYFRCSRGTVSSQVTQWLKILMSRPGCIFWEDVDAYCD